MTGVFEPDVCPTLCDDDCDTDCHELHQIRLKRQHNPKRCPGRITRVKWVDAPPDMAWP